MVTGSVVTTIASAGECWWFDFAIDRRSSARWRAGSKNRPARKLSRQPAIHSQVFQDFRESGFIGTGRGSGLGMLESFIGEVSQFRLRLAEV